MSHEKRIRDMINYFKKKKPVADLYHKTPKLMAGYVAEGKIINQKLKKAKQNRRRFPK